MIYVAGAISLEDVQVPADTGRRILLLVSLLIAILLVLIAVYIRNEITKRAKKQKVTKQQKQTLTFLDNLWKGFVGLIGVGMTIDAVLLFTAHDISRTSRLLLFSPIYAVWGLFAINFVQLAVRKQDI